MVGSWNDWPLEISSSTCPARQMPCIGLLHTQDINVLAAVFDYTFTVQHISMILGCAMKVSEIRPRFPHPEKSNVCVYVILNVCHLIRNLLGDYKTIHDDKAGKCTFIC